MQRTIVLTRHTTTSWNREKRIQGQADVPLDEGGREEARELAATLAPLGIEGIMSSDLLRTRETAEIIRERIPVPIHFDPRLRECSFGTVEGMLRDEIIARYGDAIGAYWSDRVARYDFRPFGGEDRPGVLARHRAALEDIPVICPDVQVVLIVGHGRGLNTLLAGLGHDPSLERGGFKVIRFP